MATILATVPDLQKNVRMRDPSANEGMRTFDPPPSRMTEAAFVARFGAVYEHSAWIAENAWRHGLGSAEDSVAGLARALANEVETADASRQLQLIRAHPDLGGKAALAGTLTSASAREQAGAGLDACTAEQFERLQHLNSAYVAKFKFPFILAVTGMHRDDIIESMAQRLANDAAGERRRALDEIHRIAWFRLVALARP